MHEVATSQAIAGLVLKEAMQRKAKRVLEIEVEIGQLTFLSPEQVTFWVQEGLRGTIGEGAELIIRLIEPHALCPACGYQGRLPVEEDPSFHWVLPSLQCPQCGSTGLTLAKGRECTLKRIELLCE